MLQRIFVMLIVGFWLAMTSLLVVREVFPEATRLNSVAVNYVGGLIFQHGQSSDLQIYDAGKEVGYLHMQPRPDLETKGGRILEYHGMITLNPLGMAKQRLSWSGAFVLTPRSDIKRLRLSISTQEPVHQLEMDMDMEAKTAKFVLRANDQTIDQSTITLDSSGLMKLLNRIGIEPAALQPLMASSSATTPAPEITAYQSSTRLNGETVATYLLTGKVTGQTLVEAHVSYLGQLLRVELPLFGYKMVPYNIQP